MTPEQIEEMRAVLLRELDGHSYAGAKYWADRICAVLAMPSPERDAGTVGEGIEDLLIGEGLPEADWVNVRITEAYRRGLANSKLGVHLSHCNFGENAGVCKYGESDCPALADSWAWLGEALQNRSTPLPATREPVAAPGIVEQMRDCLWFAGQAPDNWRHLVIAAFTVSNAARDAQWERAIMDALLGVPAWNTERIESLLQSVRRRLLAPAPAMDRVTVEKDGSIWNIKLDGESECRSTHKRDAERYAAGLRLELDASRKGQQ
jgi:hypothetical protein